MRLEVDSGLDVLILRDPQKETSLGWWFTSLNGWDGTPAPREDSTARIGLDGSYTPLTLTQGPRTITIGGAADCHSTIEASILADRVNALWGRTLRVTRVDALGDRHVTGLLRDDPQPVFRPNERVFTFSLVIQCDDPLKYGNPAWYTPENGIVTVENNGTANSWPILHASNPTGITFINAAYDTHEIAWQATGEQPVSDLTLDFRTMLPSVGTITRDDAWPIPPGGLTFHVNANAQTSIEIEASPCWR